MNNVWVKVHGYMTAGGDPVWRCPVCKQGEHVYGIEHPERHDKCEACGSINIYPWEKGEEDATKSR